MNYERKNYFNSVRYHSRGNGNDCNYQLYTRQRAARRVRRAHALLWLHLAWVLIRQKFCLDVLKVVGKSHFALVEALKKAIKIDEDDNDNEEVEISEKEMTEDAKRIKRMCEEYNQLARRYERLSKFLASDKFQTLSEKSCTLLEQQHKAMREYMETLKQRIELECDNNNKKD